MQACEITLWSQTRIMQWNLELKKFLMKEGFTQSKSGYSLFTRVSHGLSTFILVCVDDLLVTRDDIQGIAQVKANLHIAFTIKDLGLARYFLGIEIARDDTRTFLNKRYI